MLPIESCVSFLLGKAYQHVNQNAKQRLAPYGVTPVQYALLNVLWERDGQSGAELGERLQLDSATMTGVLDRLAHAHLIERRADPHDRRINRIFLTTQGRELEVPLNYEIEALHAEVLQRLAGEEAQQLLSILSTLGSVNRPADHS